MRNGIGIAFLLALVGCTQQSPQPEPVGAVTQKIINDHCSIQIDTGECSCVGSPIVISLDGGPIVLTSSSNGVLFKLRNHQLGLWSWTAAGSNAAWLVLDLNHNGVIDDGSEMFGDGTLQAVSADPNGFMALGLYDGNHDGAITPADATWTALRLWRDANHDGVSQPEELIDLDKAGIHALSLSFHTDGAVDEFGNEFRVAAPVTADAPVASTAYDVWLTSIVPNITPTSGSTASTQWLCAALSLRSNVRLDGPCAELAEPVVCLLLGGDHIQCATKVLRYGQSTSMLGAAHLAGNAVTLANSALLNNACPRVYLHGTNTGEDPLPFPGGTEGHFDVDPPNDVSYRCIQVEVTPPSGPSGPGNTCSN